MRLVILISTGLISADVPIRTDDVCSHLTAFRTESVCNSSDFCEGLTDPERVVSCDDAFMLVTRRQSRSLSLPPIIIRPTPEESAFATIDTLSYVNDNNALRDSVAIEILPQAIVDLIKILEHGAEQIVTQSASMFPRLVYNEEIEGMIYRNVTMTSDELKQTIGEGSHTLRLVGSALRASRKFRKWAWYLNMMMQQLPSFPIDKAELIVISMTPMTHAFTSICADLHLDFPSLFSGLEWVLYRMVTQHPLYDEKIDVWRIRMNLDTTTSPLFPLHSPMDWEYIEDFVWNVNAVSRDPTDLMMLLLTSIRGVLDEVKSPVRIFGQGLVYFRKKTAKLQRIIKSTIYSMRYLDEFEPSKRYPWRFAMMNPLDINAIVRFIHVHRNSMVNCDFAMIESLASVFKRHLDIRLKMFMPSNSIVLRKALCPVLRIETGMNLTLFVDQILAFDTHDLFFLKFAATRDLHNTLQLFSQPLPGAILARDQEGDTRLVNFNTRTEVTLGRTIALLLRARQWESVRSILPHASNSTVLETVFFGSSHVRKGFYDLFPLGYVERMFSSGDDFVASISRIAL